ncbi:DUF2157 domain-containing protein [Nostocoides sp. F2B08]|uniref:DUF2157 domain-containing protein n=1 Tax=Nostocoides sp. F2B08 TaxID=2653936 RepID=UPI001262D861|nr:DUF2157 domain-containing protein [Tetrasphaera sp. F2B08]KAB7741957.1 DUF2157 domain-containing protein [Tetrasphaera sp. F2B08]
MSAASPSPAPVPTTAERHRWLTGELREWERDGLLTPDAAAAIADRYVVTADAGRRFTAVRVILGLGAVFIGIGLIWLVAANLDELSPLVRFLLVVALWAGLAIAAELTRDLVSAALKLLTALAAGAVVFQAAQSLQVPAYRPHLLLAWGLGALLYAYARRSRAAGLVAITVLAAWYVWQVMDAGGGVVTFTGAVLLASVASVALAALHPDSWRGFGRLWLSLGAVMSLIGAFAAAIPYSGGSDRWSEGLTAGIVLALGLAAAALWRSTRDEQVELGVAVGALVLGLVMSLWRPMTYSDAMVPDELTAEMWLRTGLAILVFLVIAGGWAVVGARRGLPVVSAAATVGVVVFTTFQSFAVFAPIISGATLFLAVGVVMLITGVVAERARRRIGSEVRS